MSDAKTVYIKPTLGFGFISLILAVLKLAGVAPIASWSWWWVTVFWWGPISIVLVVLIFLLLIAGTVAIIDAQQNK